MQLTRVPSQFDDGLSYRSAATPTCSSCCCCCCCLATTVGTPVVNGILVGDIARRNNRPTGAPAALAVFAGLSVIVLPIAIFFLLTASLGGVSGGGNAETVLHTLGILLALTAGIAVPYLLMRIALPAAGQNSGALSRTIALVAVAAVAFGTEFIAGGAIILMVADLGWAGLVLYLMLAAIALAGAIFAALYSISRRRRTAQNLGAQQTTAPEMPIARDEPEL